MKKIIITILATLGILLLIAPLTTAYSTDVYTCEKGEWENKGKYGIDEFCPHDTSGENLCWCNEESENFYVDESGGVHCRKSSYSSVNNGAWCSVYVKQASKECVASGSTSTLHWKDSLGERGELIERCETDEFCTLEGCVENEKTNLSTPIIVGLSLIILILILALLKKRKQRS